MSETLHKENFVSRWSRIKREIAGGAVPPGTVAPAAAEAPVLPSLEAIAAQGLEADYTVFLQAGVESGVRRAAVQQLFSQPIFNVMDGLDVYIEDFNVYEPLLASELPGLAHARSMLFPEPEAQATVAAEANQTDVADHAETTEEVKPAEAEPTP